MSRFIKFMCLTFFIIGINGCIGPRKNSTNESVDGIIFFAEEEKGSNREEQPLSRQSESKAIPKQSAPQEKTVAKRENTSGIIFLDYEDQINELSGQPLRLIRDREQGKASFYADKFHGRKTASGEIYDKHKFTAAHPTLKFGTRVKVTNLYNDKTVVVRINDRGPAIASRIIDLSYAAAKKLDMIKAGVAEVLVEVIDISQAR